MRDALKVHEIAPLLVTPRRTEEQAAKLFRKLAADGVIPPVGRIGSGKTSHYVYSPTAPAVAAVMFQLWDFGVTERGALSGIGKSLSLQMSKILDDLRKRGVDRDDDVMPALVLSKFERPQDGNEVLSYVVQNVFGKSPPIKHPTNDHDLIFYLVIHLGRVLRPFVAAGNVN